MQANPTIEARVAASKIAEQLTARHASIRGWRGRTGIWHLGEDCAGPDARPATFKVPSDIRTASRCPCVATARQAVALLNEVADAIPGMLRVADRRTLGIFSVRIARAAAAAEQVTDPQLTPLLTADIAIMRAHLSGLRGRAVKVPRRWCAVAFHDLRTTSDLKDAAVHDPVIVDHDPWTMVFIRTARHSANTFALPAGTEPGAVFAAATAIAGAGSGPRSTVGPAEVAAAVATLTS